MYITYIDESNMTPWGGLPDNFHDPILLTLIRIHFCLLYVSILPNHVAK